MKVPALTIFLLSTAGLGLASAQSSTEAAPATSPVTAEADITVGRSTENVNVAAAQVRLFGASKSDLRFFFEAVWSGRTTSTSDAFGAAYPYDNSVRPMEAYVEKMTHPGGRLFGVRLGRYRTPFGIYGRSEHAYNGFLRAPLIRYGTNWSLSNTFLEAGANVVAGTPSLYVEGSVGTPVDEGASRRRQGPDVVIRAQGFYRSFIFGASTMHAKAADRNPWAFGPMVFHGIDGRWMGHGVQIRGEWITGQPFDDVSTQGGYVDAMVHPRPFGPVTAVARVERLDYDAGPFSAYYRRVTVGARVRIASAVALQINGVAPFRDLATTSRKALDVGVTFSHRF